MATSKPCKINSYGRKAFSAYLRQLRNRKRGGVARAARLEAEVDLLGLRPDGALDYGLMRLWYWAQRCASQRDRAPNGELGPGVEVIAFLSRLIPHRWFRKSDAGLPQLFWLYPDDFATLCDAVRRGGRTVRGLTAKRRALLYSVAAATGLPAAALARVTPEDCRFWASVKVFGISLPLWVSVPLQEAIRSTAPGDRLWPGDWAEGNNPDAVVLDDYRAVDARVRPVNPDKPPPSFGSFLTTKVRLGKRSTRQLPEPATPFGKVKKKVTICRTRTQKTGDGSGGTAPTANHPVWGDYRGTVPLVTPYGYWWPSGRAIAAGNGFVMRGGTIPPINARTRETSINVP